MKSIFFNRQWKTSNRATLLTYAHIYTQLYFINHLKLSRIMHDSMYSNNFGIRYGMRLEVARRFRICSTCFEFGLFVPDGLQHYPAGAHLQSSVLHSLVVRASI